MSKNCYVKGGISTELLQDSIISLHRSRCPGIFSDDILQDRITPDEYEINHVDSITVRHEVNGFPRKSLIDAKHEWNFPNSPMTAVFETVSDRMTNVTIVSV